jgi:hypothetical protein
MPFHPRLAISAGKNRSRYLRNSSRQRLQGNEVTPNLSVNRTARKLRLRVPSALRAPTAGYLKRQVAYCWAIPLSE